MTIGSPVRGKRVYLSGPMSGYENFNFPAFAEAAEILREQGYDVFSPHEQGWGDGDPQAGIVSDEEYQQFLREDFKQVSQADAIYVLPDWEESPGATREVQVARWCGIPVYDFVTGEPIPEWINSVIPKRHPNSARFHKILRELGELHDLKGADYGRGDDPFANVRSSEEWGLPGWVGAMIRAQDKIRRLQTLLLKGKLKNESAEDSFRDLAVYAVIALVLFEESQRA